jgi:hypothetical protein
VQLAFGFHFDVIKKIKKHAEVFFVRQKIKKFQLQ